jgi:hypothetical protein
MAALLVQPVSAGTPLFSERFSRPDGLISNGWAHFNSGSPAAVLDPVWDVTSGSFFASGGAGWTGVPDDGDPGATSLTATGSAVFRTTTRAQTFGDSYLTAKVRVDGFTSTTRTPAVAFDGAHLWLRHLSEEQLYAFSVIRRDGTVVIKKKCPGGTTNGGTYYTLASATGYASKLQNWVSVGASAKNLSSGGVRLRLVRQGSTILDVIDRGTGCAPIRKAGAIGLRGDNAELRFDDLSVVGI